MPALHWAITSSGPEMMNSGEPTTGRRRRSRRMGGRLMGWLSGRAAGKAWKNRRRYAGAAPGVNCAAPETGPLRRRSGGGAAVSSLRRVIHQ
ncbi:hypothetical protein GCM10023089_32520 [Quisquiliibacterium transsilvanicum]